MAAIAGGILSAAVMRKQFQRPEFGHVMVDVALLTIVAILMLALGAAIEASY